MFKDLRLYKKEDGEMVFGVVNGLSDSLGVEVTVLRLIVLLLMFNVEWMVLVYFVAAIIFPDKNEVLRRNEVKGNIQDDSEWWDEPVLGEEEGKVYRKPIKVAIGGKMRSGKDTLTKMIEEYYIGLGKEVGHYKFSQGINKVINEFGYKRYKEKPRAELQDVGQSLRSILGEDVWINYTLNNNDFNKDVVIISDVRQDNEINRLKELGFYLIYIDRDEGIIKNTLNELNEVSDDKYLTHETEVIDVDRFDFIVENNGDLEDLNNMLPLIIANIEVYTKNN